MNAADLAELWRTARRLLNAGAQRVGRSAEFVPNGGEGAYLLTNDGNPNEAASAFTLSISVERVGEFPAGLKDSFARGQLRYGAGGHSELVEFDIAKGLMLTVPTSAVDLKVRYFGKIGPKLNIGAHLSPGVKNGAFGLPVRLTERAATAVLGPGIDFAVPRRAIGVYVVPTSLLTVAVLSAFDANDATLYASTFGPLKPGIDVNAMPILSGVEAVNVINLGPAPDVLTLVWLIAI